MRGRIRISSGLVPRRPTRLDDHADGRILSIPYPQELNGILQIVGRKREGAEFCDMICDAFDVMLEESAHRPLVMGVALHGYLKGHPHRLKHLDRALSFMLERGGEQVCWTIAGRIDDHYRSLGI